MAKRHFDKTAWDTAFTESGLSIYQVALKARTPMFRMRRIEHGSMPPLDRRLRIAEVLDADADVIWPVDT